MPSYRDASELFEQWVKKAERAAASFEERKKYEKQLVEQLKKRQQELKKQKTAARPATFADFRRAEAQQLARQPRDWRERIPEPPRPLKTFAELVGHFSQAFVSPVTRLIPPLRRVFETEGPPTTRAERAAETAGRVLGELALLKGAGRVARAVSGPLRIGERATQAAARVTEAARRAPAAAKAAAAGAALYATKEATRGMLVPEAKTRTLPAKFGASLRVGFGDIIAAAGTWAKMAKNEALARKLERAARAVQRGYEVKPEPFSWKSFFDPDFYAVNAARSLPLTLALIPAAYFGWKTGGGIAGALRLGPFWRLVLQSLLGAAASRPLEAAFEAADTYERHLAEHPGDRAGAERAAQETFEKNLLLLGLDVVELAAAFAPPQLKVTSRLAKVVEKFGPRVARAAKAAATLGVEAGMEAGEEAIQEIIQRTSTGEPVRFDDKMKEAMAIGGLFGLAFGGAGEIADYVREKTFAKLPPELQREVAGIAAGKAHPGEPPAQALERALDEVLEADPEKAAVVRSAVEETLDELDGLIDEAGELYRRPEVEELVRKAHEEARAEEAAPRVEAPEVAEVAPAAPPAAPPAEQPTPPAPEERVKTEAAPAPEPELAEAWDKLTREARYRVARRLGYNKKTSQTVASRAWGELSEGTRTRIASARDVVLEEVRKATEEVVPPAAPPAPEAPAAPAPPAAPVRPEVGGYYRVRITKSTGSLKAGQEFVGRAEKIFKARSGAVLVRLVTPEGVTRNIPITKYAEWYPAGEEPAAPRVPDEVREVLDKWTEKGGSWRVEPSGEVVFTPRAPKQFSRQGYAAQLAREMAEHGYTARYSERQIFFTPGTREEAVRPEAPPAGAPVEGPPTEPREVTAPVAEGAPEAKEEAEREEITPRPVEKPEAREEAPRPAEEVEAREEVPGEPRAGVERAEEEKPSRRVIAVGAERGGNNWVELRVTYAYVPPGGKKELTNSTTVTVKKWTSSRGDIRLYLRDGHGNEWGYFDLQRNEFVPLGKLGATNAPLVPEIVKAAAGRLGVTLPEEEPAPPAEKTEVIPEARREEGVPGAPERRGDIEAPPGEGVEGRGEEVLGEVAPEVERPAEAEEEVRERPEQRRGAGREDVQPHVPRPEREARGEERERPARKGEAPEHREAHGGELRPDGERVAVSAAREGSPPEGRNYVIADPEKLEEGGVVTKARRNLAALKVLKQVEAEGRPATPEEQEVLGLYTGWGAAWQVFSPKHWEEQPSLRQVYDELTGLLTRDELDEARRSTQYAHYTAPAVVKAMWKMAERLGFKGGSVLEPALGTGYFFGLMPQHLAARSRLVGVEIESLAGRIARLLYPKAKVFVQGFEDVNLPDNYFDLAISNVPFGDIPVHDPKYPKYLRDKLHTYFFVKALDKVRPGGLIMFISSTGLMDSKENVHVRRYLAQHADLVAAIRLPGQTHKKVAQTEVTSDIIILRKRLPGEQPSGEAWEQTVESGVRNKYGDMLLVNEYFTRHPEMVLGELVPDKLHFDRIGVDGSGIDLERALAQVEARLPEGIVKAREPVARAPEPDIDISKGLPQFVDGTILVREGKVYRVRGGEFVEETEHADKLKQMAGIRDAALEVFHVQHRGGSDEELKAAQAKLNELYDAFVKKYGPLCQNLTLFASDPNAYLLEALEEVEYEGKGAGRKVKSVKKADVFTKRTIRGYAPPSRVENPVDALVVTLAERGRVDMERLAELTGLGEGELAKRLRGRIFKNPETQQWETADEYLSGNVRAKLEAARAAAQLDPLYEENVKALEAVQPEEVPIDQIEVIPGAPYVPPEAYQYFLADLLNCYVGYVEVRRDPGGTWHVEVSDRRAVKSASNTRIHGTLQNPAHKLLEMLLNKKAPTEYDYIGEKERVVNPERTQHARELQQSLIKKFEEWIKRQPSVARYIQNEYNRLFNNLRLTKYDGSHLVLPGLNTKYKPWPHQLDAIWRILTSKTGVLVAHGVGKGKTLTLAAAAMELRRLGIAKKPMIVVPVELMEQWKRQFAELYPAAKVLYVTSADLPGLFPEKKREGETEEEFKRRKEEHLRKRKAALVRIAAGDWDAVVITDRAFQRLPVSAEFETEYIKREIEALEAHIAQERQARGRASERKANIKKMEAMKQRLEQRIKEILKERPRDELVMPFEELGVDWLLVDEAHRYKRLYVATKLERTGGVPQGHSARATDMLLKTMYIRSINNGRGVVFATGTPITNTVAEMFNLMRYLAPDLLTATNTTYFDSWASVFTLIGNVYEFNPASQQFEAKRAISHYVNVPELLRLYHSFADVVPNEESDPNLPRLKDGKRQVVVVPPSPQQLEFFGDLVVRLGDVRQGRVPPNEDNALLIFTDGAKASLDMRLINPNLPDDPNSKLNRAIQNIYEIWERTKEQRSTQLVFLDMGVPSREREEILSALEEGEEVEVLLDRINVSLYHDIKKKLVAKGIPAEEIAFIHEARKAAEKSELARKFNEGEIRILIGSSGKMGIGMNLQKKLIALHHLDVPWRPDELEQREGRILRPGNENPEVEIYVYGTERSFDVHRWNKVVYKAGFIRQTLTRGTASRRIEAFDDPVLLSYEEARAAHSGNPLLEEKLKLDNEIMQLEQLRKVFIEERYKLIEEKQRVEDELADCRDRVEKLQRDVERREDVRGDKFRITVRGKTYNVRSQAAEALVRAWREAEFRPVAPNVLEAEVGEFAGFKLVFAKVKGERTEDWRWVLRGELDHFGPFHPDSFSAETGLLSMVRAVGALDNRLKEEKERAEHLAKELERLDAEIDKPFPQEERLIEAYARRREIEIRLGIGSSFAAEVNREEGAPDDEGTYNLPALEGLRSRADKALSLRVRGTVKPKVYSLPRYAPEKTSVKQVARGLKLGVEKGIFKQGMVVADVGGGLYDEGVKYLASQGITGLVYDPYARPQEHNENVLRALYERGGADAVALNNVLNVIPEAEARADVLRFSYGLLKEGGQMVVTVYEGDRSGKGAVREFKDGTYTWQENRKLEDYEDEIRRALPTAKVERKWGAYVITKPETEKEFKFYALARPKPQANPASVLPQRDNVYRISPSAARQIAEKLSEAVRTAVYGTRAGRKLAGRLGVYEPGPHAVKTRRKHLSFWRAVGHELGHAFKEHTGFAGDPAEMEAIVHKIYPGGVRRGVDVQHEGFAEFLTIYIADRERARALAPKTLDSFERFLESNPELKQAVDECRLIAENDLLGTPLARASLYIAKRTETPTAIGTYEVPWWKRPTFLFLDGSIPFRDLYEEAVKRGYSGIDPAKKYACSGMEWDKAVKIFENGVVYQRGGRITPGRRSLLNILKEAQEVHPDGVALLDIILRAHHSLERYRRGIETALPPDEAREIVEQAEREYPKLVALAKEYSETLSETCLRILIDAGVISEETAKRVKAAYEWYMPLYVRRPASRLRREPLRESGPGIMRARGHTQEELPLIEATLMKLHDTIQAAEINRLMQAVHESLSQPNMGKFGVIVDRPTVARRFRLSTIIEQVNRLLNEEIHIDDPEAARRVITIFTAGSPADLRGREPVVVARYGDKEVFMQLAPDLFEAIQSLRPITYGMLVRVLSAIGYYGRLGALLNIRFVTNNMARDLAQSAIQSRTTFERSMLLGYLKGALTAAGYGEKAEEIMNLYIQSGAYGSAPQEVLKSMMREGSHSGLLPLRAPGWKRTATGLLVRVVNVPLDLLRIQEEAPRVAEFVAVLRKELEKHGITLEDVLEGRVSEDQRSAVEKALLEAAYASREVVVNFGLHGVHEGFRTYVRCVTFMQGGLQGIYRFYRQVREAPGATLARWFVFVLPMTLLAWALCHDDDRYREMPSEARDRYWWFPLGDQFYIAIAKPYEYALPANICERMLDWLADQEDPLRRKPLEDFVSAVRTAFGVNPAPMLISTLWNLARNKDAFGSPIVPEREKYLPPEYQYGPGTTKAARFLATVAARLMGDHAPSPRQIDYFMRNVFGGLGETAMRILSGELAPREGVEYAPVVGPLLYGPVEGGSRVVDRFYSDYELAQKLWNAYRLMGRELKTERERKLVYALPAIRAIADMLSDLRRQLREIEASDKYTPRQKRLAALRLNWYERAAAGYLYGRPVPAAPKELEITEADVQDFLRYLEDRVETAMVNAAKRPGGPV